MTLVTHSCCLSTSGESCNPKLHSTEQAESLYQCVLCVYPYILIEEHWKVVATKLMLIY